MTYHIKVKHGQYPYGESQIDHDDHSKKKKKEVETTFPPPIDSNWVVMVPSRSCSPGLVSVV